MELKAVLEEITKETFETIDEIYKNSNREILYDGSRLIFPHYSDLNKTNQYQVRVSEQELRFVFIETFCKYCDNNKLEYFYSIETPSLYKYVFSEKIESGKKIPRKADEDDDSAVSARFDMAIYNKEKKIVALVEFKNNESDSNKYEKDFINCMKKRRNVFVSLST